MRIRGGVCGDSDTRSINPHLLDRQRTQWSACRISDDQSRYKQYTRLPGGVPCPGHPAAATRSHGRERAGLPRLRPQDPFLHVSMSLFVGLHLADMPVHPFRALCAFTALAWGYTTCCVVRPIVQTQRLSKQFCSACGAGPARCGGKISGVVGGFWPPKSLQPKWLLYGTAGPPNSG
jgi:hypothetical protein